MTTIAVMIIFTALILFYTSYQRLCVDEYRQFLFDKRHESFVKLDQNIEQAEKTREFINLFIRFAEDLNWINILVNSIFSYRNHKKISEEVVNQISDKKLVAEIYIKTTKLIIKRSLFLLPVISVVFVLMIIIGIIFHATVQYTNKFKEFLEKTGEFIWKHAC